MSTPVLLDTDIGDDIDDALALALILASPELELVGITTVFGNAAARARQARTVLVDAGREFSAIPVAVGCTRRMSTMPLRGLIAEFADVDHLPNQDARCLPESSLPPVDRRHGVDFIIDTLMGGDGRIVPIAIGALTNIAMALVKEPRIAKKIPQLAIMAGEFRASKAEWNIRCDPEAAAIVFSSGIPITLIPWHIGDVVHFTPPDIARLAGSSSPLCQRLSAFVHAWQTDRHPPGAGAEEAPVPRLYDPMAVASILQPELCTWKQGTVHVELRGERTYAYTTFAEDTAGPHRVAWDADREASIAFFLKRVVDFR